jgi:putative membrane protein
MDILNNILLWVHLVSLSVGGAASFGIPVIGAMMPTASAEARPFLFKAMKGISTVSRGGLAGLIITGPLLVWLKFGGTTGFTFWFWLKMVLVLILIGLIVWAGINAKRAEGGNMDAVKRAPMIGGLAMITLLAVVFSAVFAFN